MKTIKIPANTSVLCVAVFTGCHPYAQFIIDVYHKSFYVKDEFILDSDGEIVFGNCLGDVKLPKGITKRRKPKDESMKKSIFLNLLYCGDCGHKLWFNFNQKNPSIRFYSCSNYVGSRGTCELTHYIREDSLEEVVKIEIFNVEGKGKNRTQRLIIHYRFVGCIDLPSVIPKHTYKLDSRQGVAIEYLPIVI